LFQKIIYRYGLDDRWETAAIVSLLLLLIDLKVLPVGMSEVHKLIELAFSQL
jgi:hypothetical protein